MEDSPQSKGGKARAEVLTSEKRQAIARRAAQRRWSRAIDPNRIPEASHQGTLPIGDVELDVYVLEDGRRVFHKRGMAKALGLKSEGGNAFLKTLSRKGLGSQIPDSLWKKVDNPIVFMGLGGDPAHGYEAAVLIEICDA